MLQVSGIIPSQRRKAYLDPEQQDLHVYNLMRQVDTVSCMVLEQQLRAHARRDRTGPLQHHRGPPRSANNGARQMSTVGIPTGTAHLQVQPALQPPFWWVHFQCAQASSRGKPNTTSTAGVSQAMRG